MPLAWLNLRGNDGGYAGHVGIDAHGIVGTVVPNPHLGTPVGAIEREAEVVARFAVGCPPGLQVQRCATREADKGGGQGLDLVGVTDYGFGGSAATPAFGNKLG